MASPTPKFASLLTSDCTRETVVKKKVTHLSATDPRILFPLAMLVYRSRFLPRFLGVWLVFGGIANVLLSLTVILAPQYHAVFTWSQPAMFGEVAFMLWLIVKGATPPAPDASLLSSSA